MKPIDIQKKIDDLLDDARQELPRSSVASVDWYDRQLTKIYAANTLISLALSQNWTEYVVTYVEETTALAKAMQTRLLDAKRYNGWRNYETWCVALWIDNDYGLYTRVTSVAKKLKGDTALLAKRLRNQIENRNPVGNRADVYADLMNAALSEVDWYDVARHYLPEDTTE